MLPSRALCFPSPLGTFFPLNIMTRSSPACSRDACSREGSLVILGAWSIWKHRNKYVFYSCNASLAAALRVARDEALCWSLAGDKALFGFFHLDELLA